MTLTDHTPRTPDGRAIVWTRCPRCGLSLSAKREFCPRCNPTLAHIDVACQHLADALKQARDTPHEARLERLHEAALDARWALLPATGMYSEVTP